MANQWSTRSTIYKVTLLLTYFVFLVFALAFSIPTWIGADHNYFKGLWVACNSTNRLEFDGCVENSFGDDTTWMDGVRGCWIGGMFFFLVAVIYSIVENCVAREGIRDYGVTGALTFLAGACGAAGVIVVVVQVEDRGDKDGIRDYYWGFMLACIASGLALILALVLLITRNMNRYNEKSRSKARAADYVSAHQHKPHYLTSHPSVPEYHNHGYTHGNDIPLANGVSYQHSPTAQPGYSMYQGTAFTANSLPQPMRNGYGQSQYTPYGYEMSRTNQRNSIAESADLSNGFTTELINAEHSLSRTNISQRGDMGMGRPGDYVSNNYYRPY